MAEILQLKSFSDLNLDDIFFDSLKQDYAEFSDWFKKKKDNFAYCFTNDVGVLDGFLYLKTESGSLDDVKPTLPAVPRLKVGTFKINPHGTRLGERFMKKIFDHAVAEKVSQAYVTIFERHDYLVQLFKKYGFYHAAQKTTANGTELVLIRDIFNPVRKVVADFPLIPVIESRQFLLSLHPIWHTRLLPDSILKSEEASIVQDVSHSNSIHKIYLAGMQGVEQLKTGDVLVIYRTNDNLGPAHYRSVATSVCVVENLRHISQFETFQKWYEYCTPYSVFTDEELEKFYNEKKYPWIIRFTYNLALKKRITRKALIDDVGLQANKYWGFMEITTPQFKKILNLAGENESPIVYKA